MKPIERACEVVGGQTSLAKAIGVPVQFVNQIVKGGRRMPAEHCPKIERLTNGEVTCEQLRADVEWSVLRSRPGPPKPQSTETEG